MTGFGIQTLSVWREHPMNEQPLYVFYLSEKLIRYLVGFGKFRR